MYHLASGLTAREKQNIARACSFNFQTPLVFGACYELKEGQEKISGFTLELYRKNNQYRKE